MADRWPLHPVPEKYEMLHGWVERIAAVYGVSMRVFCRRALGLERKDIDRLRDDPPMGALLALAAGSGRPVEQLRDMRYTRVIVRIWADLEEAMKREPEASARMLEGMKRARQRDQINSN